MEAMQRLETCLEPPAAAKMSEAEARETFLAMRCLRDAMLGGGDADLSLRMEQIIDEFDLLFAAQNP